MVKVAQRGRFSVYVYDETGERHHLPHCHVRWEDRWTVVELPRLHVLIGPELPAAARESLRDHLAELRAAWNRLNPRRPVR